MLKPNASIVRDLKAYDKGLTVEWNNRDTCWEIYYKRPSGKKLITPIVESIYIDGGDTARFTPLDVRILDWLYLSDTKRTGKKWKWIGRKRFNDRIADRDKKTREKFENIAKDNYNMINGALVNPLLDEPDWVRPDVQSTCRSRVMMRSGDNAKAARGEA